MVLVFSEAIIAAVPVICDTLTFYEDNYNSIFFSVNDEHLQLIKSDY